jgi:hypothetical protein
MDNSFTNLLLVMLITLIGYIGKTLYSELKEFSKKIEDIIIADVNTRKDVAQLQKDVTDHEERIIDLEKK